MQKLNIEQINLLEKIKDNLLNLDFLEKEVEIIRSIYWILQDDIALKKF